MTDKETQEALETLTQVVSALSELLGRPSRWAGSLELTDSLFSSGVAHLDGRIEITRAVWRQPPYRWRTVVHEAMHLYSPTYTSREYSLNRGWEEGVVEQMQRLLRQEVFQRIGVAMVEDAFAERDAAHEYNDYIRALEGLRRPLQMSPLGFYAWLLKTPLPSRAGAVGDAGSALPEQERAAFRRLLLLAQAKLGRQR